MAGNFENSASVILKNVRLDFFDLFTPGAPMAEKDKTDPKKWKYKVKAIIEAGSPALQVASAAMLDAATKLWGAANAANVIRSITANSKAVRNGNDVLMQDGSVNPAYKDMYFVSASNASKPQVVGPKLFNGKFVIITPQGRGLVDGLDVTEQLGYDLKAPYRGCYVNVKMQFVAGKSFKPPSGEVLPNQVFGRLEAVQFVRDGEAFGAGPTSAEGFGEEAVETSGATADAASLF